MGQIARPKGPDVRTGGWTPTPIFQRINEVVPDAVEVTTGNDPAGDSFEVPLDGLAWPADRGSGTHKLTVRVKRTGPGPVDVTVVLLQGTRVIAARVSQPGTSYADVVVNLTADEVATIDNYADLRARVVAGRPTVACCPSPLPAVLALTFSGGAGSCACLNGSSATLAYDPAQGHWAGTIPASTGCANTPAAVRLRCFGGAWGLLIGGTETAAASATCSPLALTFNVSFPPLGAVCSQTVTATVTVPA